jgi:hypothetical protein
VEYVDGEGAAVDVYVYSLPEEKGEMTVRMDRTKYAPGA